MTSRLVETAGAALCGVRLTLPLRVGMRTDEVVLEPAHCEWLVRVAAYAAARDGVLGMPGETTAHLLPGTVRGWHDGVRCLESCVVDLRDARGHAVSRREFSRVVFVPFVTARAAYLIVEERGSTPADAIAFSLHATGSGDGGFPVSVPALSPVSIDALVRSAVPVGDPASAWIVTLVHADVMEGLDGLERASRVGGVEAAGRIHARVAFDPERRVFVRVLERLIVTRETEATHSTVLSKPASWAAFLAAVPTDGPTAASHVHTHVHLATNGQQAAGSEAVLGADADPIISVNDRIMHLTTFSDPLAAALILSIYPGRRVLKLYGYTPEGTFEEEPGYWLLPRKPEPRGDVHDDT
jgi:hypothetical protein